MKLIRKNAAPVVKKVLDTAIEEPHKVLTETSIDTFNSLIIGARNIFNKCDDYIITGVNSLKFICNPCGEVTICPDSVSEFVRFSGGMSKTARSQLCTKLGIPSSYVNKCIRYGKQELAYHNINQWLEGGNAGSLLVRGYKNSIRGILSKGYAAYDSLFILKSLSLYIDMSQYRIKSYYMDEERLHLRLVGLHRIDYKEDLYPCIFISSSDVGLSSLVMNFGIYKQICTNGLMLSQGDWQLYRQRHIGIRPEDFEERLVASLKKVDILSDKVITKVRACRGIGFSVSINNLTQEDFDSVVKSIKDDTGISSEGAGKVITLMKDKYGDSVWGYINSLTEVAQDYTLERRLELETIAGNMLLSA